MKIVGKDGETPIENQEPELVIQILKDQGQILIQTSKPITNFELIGVLESAKNIVLNTKVKAVDAKE